MADHGHQHASGHGSDHGSGHGHSQEGATPGTMDLSEHLATYNTFWTVSKYSTIGLIALAALLALFRAHNGPY